MTKNQKIAIPIILCLLALPLILVVRRPRSVSYSSESYSAGKARFAYEDDFQPVAMNEEIWEWTDYKGRARSLTVHRKVKSR